MEHIPVSANMFSGLFSDLAPDQQEKVKSVFFDAHPADGCIYSWSRRQRVGKSRRRYRPRS